MTKRIAVLLAGLSLVMVLAGCGATSRYYSMPTMQFEELDYFYPVEYASVRNLQIAYIDEGSGDQALILIHGLGSNSKAWVNQIKELSKDYRVIALDLPGYFKSSKDYYPYSLKWYAQVITEFMTVLDIDKAVWVGHSMGGQISIWGSLLYPDRVEKLVLIDPAGFEKFNDGESDWFRRVAIPELTLNPGPRQIDMNLRSNFFDTPPEAEFMIKDRIAIRKAKGFDQYAYAVAENIKAMVNEPTSDRLENISHPTLIFFGEKDNLIPNAYLHGGFTEDVAKIGAERIPNNRLVMIPDCGHFAQFEDPTTVNREIEAFVGK